VCTFGLEVRFKTFTHEALSMSAFDLETWLNPKISEGRSLALRYRERAAEYTQLALMENPFPWPPEIHQAWLAEIKKVAINRYPSTHFDHLKADLKNFYQLPESLGILLGNGSNEIIQTLLHAFSGENRSILVPRPSYFVYDRVAAQMGYEIHAVDLKENFEMNLPAMLDCIEKNNPVLTFISYPNNPTGNCFSKSDIEMIIQKSRGIVVIDEAYFPYSQKTFLDTMKSYDNVLVLRSFSKVGLAAIRLGYLVGPQKIIDYISKLQVPFMINTITQITALFILRHYDFLLEQVDVILNQRQQMKVQLEQHGLTVKSSDSNYLVFHAPDHTAEEIFQHCLEQKIVIANLDNIHPLLKACCRVSMGTPAENERFLQVIAEFVTMTKSCVVV